MNPLEDGTQTNGRGGARLREQKRKGSEGEERVRETKRREKTEKKKRQIYD